MYNRSKIHFSPWIENLKNLDDIPPEFKGSYNDSYHFDSLLAIPHDIESFSYLIGVYQNHLYILHSNNNKVLEYQISFKDILYIRTTNILLISKCKIVSKNNEVEFDYSPVSEYLIDEIIIKIRKQYFSSDHQNNIVAKNNNDLKSLKYFFRYLYSKTVKENGTSNIFAHQPEYIIPDDNKNFVKKISHRFTSPTLLSFMFLKTAREYIFHDSGKTYKNRYDADYGHSTFYIPIENLSNIAIVDNEKYNTLSNIVFSIKNKKIIFAIEKNNPDIQQIIKEIKEPEKLENSYYPYFTHTIF